MPFFVSFLLPDYTDKNIFQSPTLGRVMGLVLAIEMWVEVMGVTSWLKQGNVLR